MGKTYYFVFCKEDLLLEKTAEGGYTIPYQEEPPTEVKPWTHQMDITPMADGSPVITYRIDNPITVSVPGVDGRNVKASIVEGQGTITPTEGDGKYNY